MKTLFLALVLLISISCRQNANQGIIKTEKFYLIDINDELKRCNIDTIISSINILPKVINRCKEYNSEGKLIKSISYRKGKINGIANYKYNKEWKVIEWSGSSTRLGGDFEFKWIYHYDENGNKYLDEKFHGNTLNMQYKYEYDSSGNVLAIYYIDSDGRNFWSNHYTYDSIGRKDTYRMAHKMKEQEESAKYKYDSKNNLLSEEKYDYKNNLQWKEIYKYDENDNIKEAYRYNDKLELVKKSYEKNNDKDDLIEFKTFDKDNNQLFFIRHIYRYDLKGNKVIDISLQNGIVNEIKVIEIEYN